MPALAACRPPHDAICILNHTQIVWRWADQACCCRRRSTNCSSRKGSRTKPKHRHKQSMVGDQNKTRGLHMYACTLRCITSEVRGTRLTRRTPKALCQATLYAGCAIGQTNQAGKYARRGLFVDLLLITAHLTELSSGAHGQSTTGRLPSAATHPGVVFVWLMKT